jgi:hypothetical protein
MPRQQVAMMISITVFGLVFALGLLFAHGGVQLSVVFVVGLFVAMAITLMGRKPRPK